MKNRKRKIEIKGKEESLPGRAAHDAAQHYSPVATHGPAQSTVRTSPTYRFGEGIVVFLSLRMNATGKT
jgi:hypothetical protein